MSRRSPELMALLEYLLENGRSPREAVVAHAMRVVDPSKAIRKRQHHRDRLGGKKPRYVALQQQVLIGQRKIVSQKIWWAVRGGTVVKHEDGTMELARKPLDANP